MKGRRWLPLLVLGVGAAAIIWALVAFRPAPVVPRDGDHLGEVVPAGCLPCHGPAGSAPRPASHPISEACFSCHRWQN